VGEDRGTYEAHLMGHEIVKPYNSDLLPPRKILMMPPSPGNITYPYLFPALI
jgi:hypothetical protein